ncbi:MAG: hypothetical protein Q8K98_09725 [Bacteroidota bacterium]|nr:hypothetical protein [Bacteroidota bacterium]
MKASTLALNLIFAFLVLIISSCGEAPIGMTPVVDIYGVWVEANQISDLTIFNKTSGLDSNKLGLIFYEGFELLERNNAGWCETSPISYQNYNGNWKLERDSIVNITVGYWGGIRNYSFRIISLNATEMKIKYQ